jgi:uncharacterized coiled-coil DUF342 family protein
MKTVSVIALLVLLTGIGAFEARRAARFRDQRQELARQMELLTRQADQLRQERDVTTAALKNLHERFAQLEHNRAELMRLRGQVGPLLNEMRELLSLMKSSGSLTHNAVRDLALNSLVDEAMLETMLQDPGSTVNRQRQDRQPL